MVVPVADRLKVTWTKLDDPSTTHAIYHYLRTSELRDSEITNGIDSCSSSFGYSD